MPRRRVKNRAAVGREPDTPEDLREARGFRGDHEVAGERDAPANADCRPVYRGNDRLFNRMESADEGVAAALHAFTISAQIVRLSGHSVHVGAGAEPSAGSGHDDDAHLVVEPQLREVIAQALTHIDGQRVELVGAV